MKSAFITTLAVLGIWATEAQTRIEVPVFDAVSIKPCDPAKPQAYETWSRGRLREDCITAERLILLAYVANPDGKRLPRGLSMNDVILYSGALVRNGPSWLGSRRFTIAAVTNSPAGLEMMLGPLMQGVLADRFQLRMHEESHPTQVYELIQDSRGTKLSPARQDSCFQMNETKAPPQPSGGQAPPPICGGYRVSPNGGVDAFHITMAALCRNLSSAVGKPLVDKTGLSDTYDIHLDLAMQAMRPAWMPLPQPGSLGTEDFGTSVFTAVRKLGLRIKPAAGVAKVIVIDHIELPSPN